SMRATPTFSACLRPGYAPFPRLRTIRWRLADPFAILTENANTHFFDQRSPLLLFGGIPMSHLRRLFFTRVGPNLFGAAVIAPLLTAVGLFTFIAGVLYLPSLGPTRVEMILALLLLAAVAL